MAVQPPRRGRRRAEALAGQLEGDVGDAAPLRWSERILAVGKPLLVGLALFAVAGAALAWALVHLAWIAAVTIRRGRRRQRARAGPT